jgi:SAM-dependent methyltransferase
VQSLAEGMPFGDCAFTLVTALGLIPWLPDAAQGVRELVRVVAPGGWLLATADSRARLSFLFEPSQNPLLEPLKAARDGLRRARGRPSPAPMAHLHHPAEVDILLRAAGAEPVRRATIGFGPFTFRGHPLLPERLGIALHERLERGSARSAALRRTGWHYVVLARRTGPPHSSPPVPNAG